MKELEHKGDLVFDIINSLFIGIITLIIIYPLYFIIIASISDPTLVSLGRVFILPKGITLEAYSNLLKYREIWIGYGNSIRYTILGTVMNLILTLPAGYVLSRKDFPLRRPFMVIILFTMLFRGGLIPRYLLVMNLGILNTVWAIILPRAVLVLELIIVRTYFETTLPDGFLDAAKLEGASNIKFFMKIALPLSQALLAVMVIRYGVTHWNLFFDALIFLRDSDKYPLQLVLRNILLVNQMSASMMESSDILDSADYQKLADLIRYAVIIVGSLPFLILYPFMQKFFVKGIMIGGLKG